MYCKMITTKNKSPETETDAQKFSATNNNPATFGSKKDVARMLQMSVRSVDNFLAAGLPHVKISSRRVRFDLPECRQWFKERFGQQRRGRATAGN
jgi:predicted DNA-binding transcriptional regulator AlpA